MDFSYVTDTGLTWPKGRVKRSKTDHIQIHHTVGEYGTPAKWAKLHANKIADGHKGVGYSYLILSDGTIYLGRGHEYAHGGVKDSLTNNANQRSVAIAFNGDLRKGDPTPAAKASAKRLISDLQAMYKIPGSAVIGHNEVPVYENGKPTGKLYATLCPVMDMRSFRAYLAGADNFPPATPGAEPENDDEPESNFPAAYRYAGATYVNLRNAPKNGTVIGKVIKGDTVIVLDLRDGWAEVVKHNDTPMLRGWCSAQHLTRS